MTKKRFLFSAGERLRGLRELMGLSRPAFAEIVGIKPKRLENIENGLQKMHDEDFEKVCSVYEEFSRWIAYEGPVDRQIAEFKVADSAQKAAVYLVKQNPELLERSGVSIDEWQRRHQATLDELSDKEAE
ncbi:MAG: helix-turn-helix domain-containing protein [Pseudomonas sp.]|uniref:helix-turn-helix domain-containing protein n=1 Tax=Pseudomonas sp. TaxID=306 RepID=UPI003D114A18